MEIGELLEAIKRGNSKKQVFISSESNNATKSGFVELIQFDCFNETSTDEEIYEDDVVVSIDILDDTYYIEVE